MATDVLGVLDTLCEGVLARIGAVLGRRRFSAANGPETGPGTSAT